MKNIQYIIYLSIAAVFAVACDDFLVRTPKDKITPETYFTGETDCALYTNEFYLAFPGASSMYGESADYIIRTTVSDEVRGARLVPATSGLWNWESLRTINFFLEHSGQCSDVTVRNKYVALARFFRAYFYFDKIKYYGDVPWIDRTFTAQDEGLYQGRDDRKYVFEKMLEDIDYAIEHLTTTKSVYTVTKWTALALKSRMCLFEGTFRKYHGIEDWEEVLTAGVDASKKFIKSSGYAIYTGGSAPYRDLFTFQNSNSSEVILARAYSSNLGLTHDANGWFTSPTMGRSGLAKDVVNMYLMADGSRFTDIEGYDKMTFEDETKARDPRLAQSIRTPGYTRIGSNAKVAPNLAACITGYQITKYVCSTKYDSYNTSENDFPLFRTAEVYLNHAESMAELGTLTQSELDLTVNKIRARVGMPSLNMDAANADPDPYLQDAVTGYTGVTGPNTGVILEIRRERTVELLCEGFRYWDIMRWKAGKRFERPFLGMYFPSIGSYDLDSDGNIDFVIYSGTKPEEVEGVVYMSADEANLSEKNSGNLTIHADIERNWNEDRDYLYPIPTDEITLTYGKIKQNPNW